MSNFWGAVQIDIWAYIFAEVAFQKFGRATSVFHIFNAALQFARRIMRNFAVLRADQKVSVYPYRFNS